MKLARSRMVQETVELNITAFLNLMVILVPFLLITAVFSRISILELNLPPKNAKAPDQEKISLQLEMLVRPESFEIRDANLGRIKYLERKNEKADWKSLSNVLVELKTRFPEQQNITLMVDYRVNYKTLIQVMDRVRSIDVVNVTDVETRELFPNISIADAPETDSEATQAPAQPAAEGAPQ